MRGPLSVASALSVAFVCTLLLFGCTTDSTLIEPTATPSETSPTVGDTISLPSGDVTLVSASAAPPASWNTGSETETLWLSFEFRNTSDSSVTVFGFRGAPEPSILAANGDEVLPGAKSTRFTGGAGGWGFGQPESVTLDHNGVIYATFGTTLTEEQYLPGELPASVTWQPTDGESATFELP